MKNIITTFSLNIIIVLKCLASETFLKCFLMIFFDIVIMFDECVDILFCFSMISYEYIHEVYEMSKISYKYHMKVFFF